MIKKLLGWITGIMTCEVYNLLVQFTHLTQIVPALENTVHSSVRNISVQVHMTAFETNF